MFPVYAKSKLANLLFAREWGRRLRKIHPGITVNRCACATVPPPALLEGIPLGIGASSAVHVLGGGARFHLFKVFFFTFLKYF